MSKKIYIASKTRHADKWLKLRSEGVNIISSWIDEAGPGESKDLKDLCYRCLNECMECDAMIVYAEEGDVLVGAYLEMGSILGDEAKEIYLVGPVLKPGSVFNYAPNILPVASVDHALLLINPLPSTLK